jgi:transposase
MAKPREFKSDFKARVVLQVLTRTKSAAQVCREHKIHEQLFTRWKNQFLERASLVFDRPGQEPQSAERIAELERFIGRLTLELEIAKKASQLLSLPVHKSAK